MTCRPHEAAILHITPALLDLGFRLGFGLRVEVLGFGLGISTGLLNLHQYTSLF